MNNELDVSLLAMMKKNNSQNVNMTDLIKAIGIAKKYNINNYVVNGYDDGVIDSMYDIAKTVVSNKGTAATNTTELFGNLTGNYKWRGGALAPNGKI